MAGLNISASLCVASLCVLFTAQVHAASAQPGEASPAKTTRKAQAGKSAKLMVPEGSGETAAARAARLKRECKGRPNAGACTGYTD